MAESFITFAAVEKNRVECKTPFKGNDRGKMRIAAPPLPYTEKRLVWKKGRAQTTSKSHFNCHT